MVSPEHFDIPLPADVAGNGFLEEGSKRFQKERDSETLRQQWEGIRQALQAAGARVTIEQSTPGMVDKTYRADPSVSFHYMTEKGQPALRPDLHVMSRFSHPNRVEESITAEDVLRDHVATVAPGIITHVAHHMEGAGDNLIDPTRGIIIAGKGQRKEEGASDDLAKKTGMQVHTIETIPPFFHVDTFLAVLPSGHAIYAEETLTPTGRAQLKHALFKDDPALEAQYGIPVSKELAHAFFCNMVPVGHDQLIVQKPHPDMALPEGTDYAQLEQEFVKVTKHLSSLGYHIHAVDAHLLNLAGGGLHCVVNRVNHPVIDQTQATEAQHIRNAALTDVDSIPEGALGHAAHTEMDQAARSIQQLTRSHQAGTYVDRIKRSRGNGGPTLLMVEPREFYPNPETAETNHYQKAAEAGDMEQAIHQHRALVAGLREQGVDVHVVKGKNNLFGDKTPELPDEVFLNNWFSTHYQPETGRHATVFYPMHHQSRQGERKSDMKRALTAMSDGQVIDLTHYEQSPTPLALEGTGSLVFDHQQRRIYMCRSERAAPALLHDLTAHFQAALGVPYEPVIFDAIDPKQQPIYHTNVMMWVGTSIAAACLDSIPEHVSEADRQAGIRSRSEVQQRLTERGRPLLELTQEQIGQFAGNAFETQNQKGQPVLAMSEAAYQALTGGQRAVLDEHYQGRVVHTPFDAIEKAGGSVRCAMAAIHTSHSRQFVTQALATFCHTSYQDRVALQAQEGELAQLM